MISQQREKPKRVFSNFACCARVSKNKSMSRDIAKLKARIEELEEENQRLKEEKKKPTELDCQYIPIDLVSVRKQPDGKYLYEYSVYGTFSDFGILSSELWEDYYPGQKMTMALVPSKKVGIK